MPPLQTTAHALGIAFGLLALYPDEQEKLYQHIISVLPDGRLPVRSHNAFLGEFELTAKPSLQTYEDMPKLTYCLA
jgi:cytochrome P450